MLGAIAVKFLADCLRAVYVKCILLDHYLVMRRNFGFWMFTGAKRLASRVSCVELYFRSPKTLRARIRNEVVISELLW